MGKQSTRENKTIYQICREEAGLTRSEASEKMTAVSDSKIEKFEYEMQEPTPYDIIQMFLYSRQSHTIEFRCFLVSNKSFSHVRICKILLFLFSHKKAPFSY